MAQDQWLTGREAAALLSKRSGHPVAPNYIRYHAFRTGKIAHRKREGYEGLEEYSKRDVEKLKPVGSKPRKSA